MMEKPVSWGTKVEGDPDTYDVVETCPECGGATKIRIVRRGRPQILPCACDCRRLEWNAYQEQIARQRANGARRRAFQSKAQESMTFEASIKPLKACRRYVEVFEEMRPNGKGLLIHGPKGSGKTYAACAVANALIDLGHKVKVTSMPRVFNEIMDTFEGRQRRIDALAKYSLVVIDDFGQEACSGKMEEVAFQVIDLLYSSRVPMIVTTNLDKDQVFNGGGKVGSRLFERCYPIEMRENVRYEMVCGR